MKSLSIAASVGLGTLTFLLLLAIMGIVILRRYLKTLNGPKIERQFGAYITTKEPPEFTIPPYTLISEGTGSEGTATPCSEVGEIENDEPTAKFSPLAVRRSLSMPIPSTPLGQRHGFVIARNKESAESGTVEEGIATKEYRPQFRRAVSQYVMLPKREPLKKASVAPYGKLEVSIQFMTEKNLLFVQVNGAFDLPHVRLSGVSTPYVRVHLLPGDRNKEPRSSFLNLATNRICMFDQLTLEEAQNCTLKFVVLDYDKFSRSEFIAEVMLSLLEIDLVEGAKLSRHLNSKTIDDSENRGSLMVSLCQQPSTGHLHVIILKATGLPPLKAEAPGGLDTFVRVLYYVQRKVVERKKTKVVKKSTSPVFNEAFVFDMKDEEPKHSSIMCEVYRGDTVKKTNRIGYITLGLESFGSELRHWNDMIMTPLKRATETHLLHA